MIIKAGTLEIVEGCNGFYLYGDTLYSTGYCLGCLGDGVDGLPDVDDPDLPEAFGFTVTNVYYSSTCDYHHPGQSYCSGAGSGSASLEETRKGLAEHVKYYQELGCQVTKAYIDKFCVECNGQGTVYRGVRAKRKRCPLCKGKDSCVRVETWVDLPKDAWID